MAIKKIEEWRPADCIYGSRIGDVVEVDGLYYLQVKCSACTKKQNRPVFHYLRIGTPLPTCAE